MAEPKPGSPLDRLHQRMDELLSEMGDLKADIATVKADTTAIKSRCIPCQDQLNKHEATLYGNGKAGLITRVTSVEGKQEASDGGRTDTLSIKGMVILLGAIGTLIGTVAGAIGGTIGALAK